MKKVENRMVEKHKQGYRVNGEKGVSSKEEDKYVRHCSFVPKGPSVP